MTNELSLTDNLVNFPYKLFILLCCFNQEHGYSEAAWLEPGYSEPACLEPGYSEHDGVELG